MAPADKGSGQLYKIKLTTGRIVGPIGLDRIRLLILKKHVTGAEIGRTYPDGEWRDVNRIPEIAELLLLQLQGNLTSEVVENPSGEGEGLSATVVLPEAPTSFDEGEPDQMLPTAVDPSTRAASPPESASNPVDDHDDATRLMHESSPSEDAHPPLMIEEQDESEAKTVVGGLLDSDDDATRVGEMTQAWSPMGGPDDPAIQTGEAAAQSPSLDLMPEAHPESHHLSQEKTVVLERPGLKRSGLLGRIRLDLDRKTIIRFILFGVVVGLFLEPYLEDEPEKTRESPAIVLVRPTLPSYREGESNPEQSEKLYDQAMIHYVEDTVVGYRRAATLLHRSVSLDISNVRALAMLASAYLNLIDSSNKDESYFAVISKLIEMSRAKEVDLPETVIADVEFFTTVNQAEAAQNRIVEYTKTHRNFPIEMFYYLAYAYYSRGDFQAAARYLSQFPDNKAVSPKIFYLRGRIAEEFQSPDQAILEYQKAVGLKGTHARSRLRIAYLLNASGRLRDAASHLGYLVKNPQLMSPRELALAYYLSGRHNELERDWKAALKDVERAVELDRGNHDYQLELYALRAKVGESDPNVKQLVKMYYFLAEGEKFQKEGKYHQALTQYLQARNASLDSVLPLMKIGDMFVQLNDTRNAVFNYEKAVKMASKNPHLWAKYVRVLIDSYEWEAAAEAMQKFRRLPGAASSADRLAGDLYAKQGQYPEALVHYRKAMARESIDPGVYISYGETLMKVNRYKEAPFFFALALRFDPLNMAAIINTARCMAQTESIDQAISMLQDQLQKLGGSRAELHAAIAELQIQKGDWERAQTSVDLARGANPEYARTWRLQAEIHLHYEGIDKKAIDHALQAYKSYSDRNPSDPSGYLERYKLFIHQSKFDLAGEELDRIYEIYPKYPGLHYYKGTLYAAMGNYKVAVKEFRVELENNPTSVPTLIELGKILSTRGGPEGLEEALGMFNQAMQLAPDEAEPKHQAGWANYILKNYDGARALLISAARIDQGNPVIFKRLGLAHRAVGDIRAGAEAFRKYLELAPDAPDREEIQKYL